MDLGKTILSLTVSSSHTHRHTLTHILEIVTLFATPIFGLKFFLYKLGRN